MSNAFSTLRAPQSGGAGSGVAVAIVFFVLAGWFLVGPNLATFPRNDPAEVEAISLRIDPLRTMQGNPPIIHLGGFDRQCMECHRFFQPERETPRQLVQHTNIILDHGLNDRCANCHDRVNANRLALRGDQTVPFTETQKLCAKCHGPTYRDWQRGMHGKTTGYWDRTRGDARRFKCVECHDPHAPAFLNMRPLPAPNTLRMVLTPLHGDQHTSPLDQVDPLRKWRYQEQKPHPPVPLPPVPLTTHTDHETEENK